jgi:hypothetical protein
MKTLREMMDIVEAAQIDEAGKADDVYVQHPDGKQEKVKWAPGMVAQHKDGRQEKVPHPSKMAHKPKKVKEEEVEESQEDPTKKIDELFKDR